MNKYELIKIIGDGTYGIVYEGRNKETKEKVAVKKLKERFISLEECLERKEVRILGQLKHENIVQLKEVIREKSGEVSYVFEYCDCNLSEFIEKHRKYQKLIPESIICEIILQITKGIKYMHSNQFFHRDLKPENILVKLNNYDFNSNNNNGQLRIKIADFGTAKEIPLKNNLPMTDYVCTRWYRAPECVLRAEFYNEKVDIWAIGCIMAELYRLSPIFPGVDEFDQIHQMLKILGTPTRGKWPWGYYQTDLLGIQFPVYYKKEFKKILQYISKEGVNLLNEIFQFESSMRPTCSKILSHPYFKMNERSPLQSNIRSLNRRNLYLNQKTDNDKSKKINIKTRIYKNKSDNNNIIINDTNGMKNNNKIKNGTKIIRRNKKYYDAESINTYQNNKNERNYKESYNKTKNNINNNKQRINRSLYISNYSSNKNIKNNYNSNYSRKYINMTNKIRRNINNDSSNYIFRNLNNISNNFINCVNNYNNNITNLMKIDTDKNIRSNKYKTINNIKSAMANKRILRFSKNLKEESKNNENIYYKKELNSNRIGSIYINEDHFSTYTNNYKGKYSYIPKNREENKEDSKNKSIENGNNKRFIQFSSDKYERPKRVIQNRKVAKIKRYNEGESDYNNLSSDGKEYNKCNSYKKTNKKNIHFEDILEKKNGNNNIIFRRDHKNINRDNHRFYESNACRINDRNNDNYYSYNGYYKCKCSFLRNNSVRKNVINNNKDEGYYSTNTLKIRNLGNYYMNNNSTPRAHSNIRKENNNALSPFGRNEKNNFLYSFFIISKKNQKKLFSKSKYSRRNDTIRHFNTNN